jgi:PAS domain S-box-containing protein
MVDFFRAEEDQRVYLDVMVPVLDPEEKGPGIGAVILRIDPEQYLFPSIQRWPGPSRTAETLLVRREGNEAVFLNELKFQKGTALSLRIPIDRTAMPAVRAALGKTEVMEGTDYRGVPVLAAVRPVPDSPWTLVARMDVEEALSPVREMRWLVALLTGALILASGAAAAAVSRQQRTRFYREEAEAAEALRLSGERFRQLIQRAPLPLCFVNEDGVIAIRNDRFLEVFGYTEKEVPTLTEWWKVAYPDEAYRRWAVETWEAAVRKAGLEGSDIESVEYNVTCREGTVRQVVISGTTLGRGFLATFLDVTERKMMEEALRDEKERFRIAAQTSNDVVYEWDLKDHVEWFGKIDEMLGHGPGEFPRTLKDWAEAVHPDDLERVMAALQAHLEGRAPYDAEYRVRRKDGSWRWWAARGEAARMPGGEPTRWIGTVTDITERKQAEEALRTSEARSRATFEQAAVGMAEVGLDGRWLRVNQRLCDIVGYTYEELLQRSFQDITHPEDLDRDLALVRQVLAGERPNYTMEKRYVRKDRSTVWINLTVGLVRDEAGAPRYFVSVVEDIATRKRAEEELAASRHLLRSLLDAITESAFLMTVDGTVLLANETVVRRIGAAGATPDSMRGENIYDLIPPALAKARRSQIAEAIESRAPVRFEDVRMGRHILNSICPVLDAKGGVGHLAVFGYDITERKLAETRVRESEAKYRTLVENIPQKIFMKDRDYRWVSINENFARDLGLRTEEVVGKVDADLFPPELAAKYHADDVRIMETGRAEELEERYIQEGVETWVNTIKTPVRDTGGEIVGVLGVFWEITERKRAEERLRQSERRFREVVESVPLLIWTCRGDGPCDYLNPQWVEYTGIPEAEQLGYVWLERLHPDDRDRALAAWKAAIEANKSFDVEFRIRRRDGIYRWFKTRAIAFRDSEGRIVKWFGTNADVDDQRRAEQEVRKLNADLDQRVIERTAQLEAANKELEAFSYSVSHDLRAPLRHVQGYVDMLAREAEGHLTTKGQRYMKTIADASGEMGVLIDDLLAFSRMGRTEMCETRVNLDTLAEDTLRDLEPATRERNIVWTIPPLPAVQADPAMLKLALANLLGNAVKFTRPRDPARIEMGTAGTDDGRVILFVRDNGVGFDPQYTHKLFGVFQRLHRADEFEGTGIGLANVRRIIARHGGRTWAEGSLDRGATFYFTLFATT